LRRSETAATPTLLREEDLDAAAALTTEAHRQEIGPDGVAIVTAWQELGYIVTEATKHLFSAHEVEAFSDALTRARNAEGPS